MEYSININNTVERNSELISSETDGEVVMMSIENGKYYGMNEIGSDIWKLIETPCTIKAVLDSLMEQYQVDYDTCLKDVLEFLEKLNKDGIINVT